MRLLETLWEASDHRCGKRLAAVLPTLVVAIETMVTWRFDRFSRHCCCSGARVQRMLGRRRLQRAQPLKRLCQLDAALRLFTNIVQTSAKRIPFEEADLWNAGAHDAAMTNHSPRPPC
ncbi:hypothetical protein KBY70_06635 [Cyanobium sp. ATX 6E8]|uniref:hypothetical protein n=1 Tax=Cyanobium sp. ATX 6E8 TaxID=2823701 RepID=UPI0020CD8953|nr:hypothetical protein [Cyanobium sp. ATX 6E8]MCP9942063.1 hypothetical protein [Cyanobium sp. ATX 6E8]